MPYTLSPARVRASYRDSAKQRSQIPNLLRDIPARLYRGRHFLLQQQSIAGAEAVETDTQSALGNAGEDDSGRRVVVSSQVGAEQLVDRPLAAVAIVGLEPQQHFREESLSPLTIKKRLGLRSSGSMSSGIPPFSSAASIETRAAPPPRFCRIPLRCSSVRKRFTAVSRKVRSFPRSATGRLKQSFFRKFAKNSCVRSSESWGECPRLRMNE